MYTAVSHVLSLTFTLFFLVPFCSAQVLEEIRPRSLHGVGSQWLGKRDNSVFNLKSTETFLWGAEDGSDTTLGNLTVEMPADQEGIVSMEKFDGLLSKPAECSDQGIVLTFNDDTDFETAKRIWDWVNGADNHQFLMVAGRGDCGENGRRLPYLISSLAYDEGPNVARLTGKTGEWKDLIHTYTLQVGSVPSPSESGLTRRDYTKDAAFSLNADFRSKVKVKTGPVFAELVCDPCYTAGSLNFALVVKATLGIPTGLQFRAAPKGVKAQADLKFELASDYGSKINAGDKKSLGKIPLAGVSIPGNILTIGPVIDFQVGLEITGFEGGVSFRTGMTATMPDSAILQADLLSPENNKFSGWTPKLDTKPLTAQARIAAYAKLYLEPALQLEASALGQGFETGIGLKMPFIEIRGEALVSPDGGACKAGDNYDAALKIRTSYGFECKFTAGKINGKQNVDVILGTASYPIGEPLCLGWDTGSGPLVSPSSAGLPAPSGGTTPPPTGGANTCTANGKSGTCIATASCKSSGGTSTPNKCPNDPDGVQCCTTASGGEQGGTPNTCNAAGNDGTCITTAACTSKGGITTKNKCPNDPDDILCCTTPPASSGNNDPPPSTSGDDTCKLTDGTSGTCQSTASCKSSGGKSTPNLCPGATNIQCCTKAAATSPVTCKAGGKDGTCIATADCTGTSTPGLCPGAANIQCCT